MRDETLEAPSICRRCDRSVDDPSAVLTWSLEVDDGQARWYCPTCAREVVGEVEARLDLDAVGSGRLHWTDGAGA